MVESDNSILVGGRFFTDSIIHNNIESLRMLCRIDSLGAPDPDFPVIHCADPIDGKIMRMDTLSDGSLIVTGDFRDLNGYAYNTVGKLNPDFSVDTTFMNAFMPGLYDPVFLKYIDSQDRSYIGTNSPEYLIDTQPNDDSVSVVRLLPNGMRDYRL